MKPRLYAIRDTVAQTIKGGVHIFKHEAQAMRFFSDIATDERGDMRKHPNDYEFIMVGHINEETGQIDGMMEPLVITTPARIFASMPTTQEN